MRSWAWIGLEQRVQGRGFNLWRAMNVLPGEGNGSKNRENTKDRR